MKKIHILSILFLTALFFTTACDTNDVKNKEEIVKATAENVDESDLLLTYIENSGDFMNSPKVPALIPATEVKQNLANYLVIDLRPQFAYLNGHIDGAVNIKLADLYSYLRYTVPTNHYEKIVLVCHSGQTASYATSLFRIIGFGNVYAMKWGMSSWNKSLAAEKWSAKVSNKFGNQLETKGNAKNAKGAVYPILNTGETSGYAIALQQADTLLTQGFNKAMVKADDVMANPEKYYIINYWPIDQYVLGHLPGAVQYQPKKSLKREASLASLPTDKPIVVYCYTGQHSAFATAYLRMLGYDAYSLSYGANSFMHGVMKSKIGHAFDPATEVQSFELTEGELPSKKVAVAQESTEEKVPTAAPVVKKKAKVEEEEGGC